MKIKNFISYFLFFLLFFLPFVGLVNFKKIKTETETETSPEAEITAEVNGENCYNPSQKQQILDKLKKQYDFNSLTSENYQEFKTFFQENQFEERIVKEWNFFSRDYFNLEEIIKNNILEKNFEEIKLDSKITPEYRRLILSSVFIFNAFVIQVNETVFKCIPYLLKKENIFNYFKKNFFNLFALIDKKKKFSLTETKSLNWANFLKVEEQDKFWYQPDTKKYKFWYQLKTDKNLLVQKQVQEIEKFFSLEWISEVDNDSKNIFLKSIKKIFFEKWTYFFKKMINFTKLKIGNRLYFDSKKKWLEFSFLVKKNYSDYEKKTWDQILSPYLNWEKFKIFMNQEEIITYFVFFWPSFKEEITFNDFKKIVDDNINITLEKLLAKKFTVWKKMIFQDKKENINRIQKISDKQKYKLLIPDRNDLFQIFYFKTEKHFNDIYSQKKISDISLENLLTTEFAKDLFNFNIRDKDEALKLNEYKPKVNLKVDKIKKTINKIQNKPKQGEDKTLQNIFIISGVGVFALLVIGIFFKIFKKIKIKYAITVSEKAL